MPLNQNSNTLKKAHLMSGHSLGRKTNRRKPDLWTWKFILINPNLSTSNSVLSIGIFPTKSCQKTFFDRTSDLENGKRDLPEVWCEWSWISPPSIHHKVIKSHIALNFSSSKRQCICKGSIGISVLHKGKLRHWDDLKLFQSIYRMITKSKVQSMPLESQCCIHSSMFLPEPNLF